MDRDRIDWGKMNIPFLFGKVFVPTLLGMLLASTINIADGAFVGQGAGSDALAAVNIVAPFFLITAGVGLMFGSGVSIVASVHLSQGKQKAADINVTQAFTVSVFIMVIFASLIMVFPEAAARMMGCSDRLMPYVKDYMRWVIPSLPFDILMSTGLFVIRLDGTPVYAMICNVLPAIVNIVLDYVFVFPLRMGIEGASLATGIAHVFGALMIGIYMWRHTQTIRLYRPKFTIKSIRLTLRNVGYQIKLGAPSMIGELAIACMMLTGNFVFIKYLGEDGVAAFSVACYCFPLVFMIGNAIAQSAQPIISYNHGAGLHERVSQTFHLSIAVAFVCGLLTMLCGMWGSTLVVSLFLPVSAPASLIANAGLPYFSVAFLFFALNLVCIGYYQSIERFRTATLFMSLRGLLFVVPAFLLLPYVTGIRGLWSAVPLSEALTLAVILCYYIKVKNNKDTVMKKTILGILPLAVFLSACHQEKVAEEQANYSVCTIEKSDVTLTESYSASIQGRQDIDIYPQVSGTIQQVCVKEGQEVHRGERLFIIDQVPYQAALRTAVANVRSAEAQVQTARLTYESKQALHREQVISEYDLSTARNALAVAEAALEQAKAQEVNARNDLSYTEVKSPSDGIVGTLPYRAGALVGPSIPQPLTTVSDHAQMYVYFSMTENQLRGLMHRYGSLDSVIMNTPPVRLQLNDGTLYDERGRIESISGVINRQTGTVSVRSVFPNTKRQLLSGGIGNVVISYQQKDAIIIPQTATMELQDKILVYKVNDDNTVSSAFIVVDQLNDGKQYIVRSGLSSGDRIVSEGVGLLQDGMTIDVKKDDNDKKDAAL